MSATKKRTGRKNKEILPDDCPNQARRLRLEHGKTLDEVCSHILCRRSALAEYETTGNGLGRHKEQLLADALGVSLGTLLEPGASFAQKVRQLP